jgi:excinuclease ABC subunit A
LKGEKRIDLKRARRRINKSKCLELRGASANNLKNIRVRIPLNVLSCLTGVSGSGKSTLAVDILYNALKRSRGHSGARPGTFETLIGADSLRDVVLVDQKAIGRTPRANLLTYMKAMDPIRHLLAATMAARQKKLGPGAFSFNVPGGRCEACKGEGFEKVEMQFLSDVYVKCTSCNGKRFKEKVLDVTYKEKNIHDILSLTVKQAFDFFLDQPKILAALKVLIEVGLDYLCLGQPISTLSGGEAQRLKLSRYLKSAHSVSKQGNLFIFDEPTTGLHFEDIHKLLGCLDRLVDQGHSVLVIEHNLDVIKNADWIIDLGPEGGDEGGKVVVTGSPETVAAHSGSHTGRYLGPCLDNEKDKFKFAFCSEVKESIAPYKKIASARTIDIRGANEHNLKNIHLSIPHQQIVALTGVSGSGKSTLAFDILFAEGQRRYLESLTPYVRQYMKIMERPDVDLISGMAPTVAIEQRVSYVSRRSTVATLTEIYHFLRLLFSKLGVQTCPGCRRRLTRQSKKQIVEQIRRYHSNSGASVLVPKISGRKGFHKKIFSQAKEKGIREVRVDGEMRTVQPDMGLNRYQEHTIEWIMGQLSTENDAVLIQNALQAGEGNVAIVMPDGTEIIYSVNGLCSHCGVGVQKLDPRLFSFNSRLGACPRCDGLGEIDRQKASESADKVVCDTCMGSRLNNDALSVTVGEYSIWDMVQKPTHELLTAFNSLHFSKSEAPIADPILSELKTRLDLLEQLGLSYLALSRSGHTLSGGEAQRVRLASQLGSNLTGICYILDEPTIGLHSRDNNLLIDALRKLRDRGNTILVVEHEEETIKAADHIIDLGPGAGQSGGQIVAQGNLDDIISSQDSLTGKFLKEQTLASTSRLRAYRQAPFVEVVGASTHNLKNIHVKFPLGCLICVTGVSGSGKSSLVKETLYKGTQAPVMSEEHLSHNAIKIKNIGKITRALDVDHSPIGRTPRSIPVSYIGVWTSIRNLFALTPAARSRGYKASRFSFNVSEGRCDGCKGQGHPKVTMSFLPDVTVPCENCGGKRYNADTLSIQYKKKTIAEVLALTFEEAASFFAPIPKICKAMKLVCDIGLGYLQLGQPSPTLSGGEAQRIKLAQQLVRPQNGHTLYVLDEPTTGLHMADVQKLIDVLQQLVDNGNTVAVIEHNLEVIKNADYIIDLGPEGGDAGGRVVASGSPPELLKHSNTSYTAQHLARRLAIKI